MRQSITNIYVIDNLERLEATYRLCRIRGLSRANPHYYRNRQLLINRLSRRRGETSPVTIIDIDDQPHLVLRGDVAVPESPYMAVGGSVYFDEPGEHIPLDFRATDENSRAICQRFLDFSLQGALWINTGLWQPVAGAPFYQKAAAQAFDNDAVLYRGFTARTVPLPDGGFGVALDIRHRFLGGSPLPTIPGPFEKQRCIKRGLTYRMGHQWYDIKALAVHDLNVSEVHFEHPATGDPVSLLDYLIETSRKPIPEELAGLPADAGVLLYKQNGLDRFAPAGLCYPIEDTETGRAAAHHRRTILGPAQRRTLIGEMCGNYLKQLPFGEAQLRVSGRTWKAPRKVFAVPDIEFGNGHRLGVGGGPGVERVGLSDLGRRRQELLYQSDAGLYQKGRFDRQYYIVPESVMSRYGPKRIDDLKAGVGRIYPEGGAYKPEIVTYADRGPKTFVEQGDRILEAVKGKCESGYALVLIHETEQRGPRQQDRLAAMVVGELRGLDVYAAVHHTRIPRRCYQLAHDRTGNPYYRTRRESRGLLAGYLRGVVLNKVLLPNERWPFVLARPDDGTVTIGIDVKSHVAGFTFVYAGGRRVTSRFEQSQQGERLDAAQVERVLTREVREEFEHRRAPLEHVVVHRDGTLFEPERQGIERAVARLRGEGVLDAAGTVNLLEIRKTSRMPVRLFEEIRAGNGRRIENPRVGTYLLLPGDQAFLCNTGYPFNRPGTVNPLYVVQVAGGRPFEESLKDLHHFSHLAWTKPDDCSRLPITLRLTDVRLTEEGGEYAVQEIENYAATRESAS